MNRHLWIALVVATAGLGGCATPKRIDVDTVRHEAIAGEIDAQWFEREVISSATGGVIAIELVYCPNTSTGEEPCRTAIIWRAEKSRLVDAIEAPKPAASPTPK